jgi:hypothetical protein
METKEQNMTVYARKLLVLAVIDMSNESLYKGGEERVVNGTISPKFIILKHLAYKFDRKWM